VKRHRLLLAGLLLGLILTGWWWSGRTPRYTNLPPRATGDWIAFGDSLTQGYGASEGKDYPALLARRLGVRIRNLGVLGDTTADALNRVEAAAQAQPRVVLLCLGGNDALQQVPRDRTFANLARIIDRFHAAGSFVVLIGVRSATVRDKHASHFKQLAREKQVLLIPDLLSGVLFRPTLMSDAVHPNNEGYALIAGRLEQELQPFLTRIHAGAAAPGNP
jgi:lysophospholipase L1-like esterase